MTQPRHFAFAARQAPARLLSLFILLAFVLQGLVIQTHLHRTAPVAVHHQTSPAQPSRQDPLDPANCPLCQEILHAGAALTPVSPQLPLILGWVFTAVLGLAVLAQTPPPLPAWQSRAPPRG